MRPRPPEIPPHKLISALRSFNLLPAIIFLPTRRKCDESALEVAVDRSHKADQEKQRRRNELFEEFAVESPEIRTHKHAKILLSAGVASHHAGHIPAWKLLIEKMMSSGLLNAIFATSTVAAGVDFPARTVVISNADTRGNDGWRPLTANELQQMTGRAGRRGKDNVGFVVLVPGQFQDPKKLARLLKDPPDPLESRFRSTYTSLLNLLDAFGNFEQVRQIAEKSYAHQRTARRIQELSRQRFSIVEKIEKEISHGPQLFSLDEVLGFERLTSAKRRIEERRPATRAEARHGWLLDNVVAGRVVRQGGGRRLYFVLSVHGERITAMREDGEGRAITIERIDRIYKNIYPVKEANIKQAFADTARRKNPPLEEPRRSKQASDTESVEKIFDHLIGQIVGEKVSESARNDRTAILWDIAGEAAKVPPIERDIGYLYSTIWGPFEKRAKVLDHFGYLDFHAEKVTESGKWLADVRVDRTLLVGEAIRRGVFDTLKPAAAAGLMASLAADPDRNFGELDVSDELMEIVNEFEEIVYDVSAVEWRFGIEPSEELNLSAAAAAEFWAGGCRWEALARRTGAEEGDLFRLLSRTGEALMQIARLNTSKPAASEVAFSSANTILRDPIR